MHVKLKYYVCVRTAKWKCGLIRYRHTSADLTALPNMQGQATRVQSIQLKFHTSILLAVAWLYGLIGGKFVNRNRKLICVEDVGTEKEKYECITWRKVNYENSCILQMQPSITFAGWATSLTFTATYPCTIHHDPLYHRPHCTQLPHRGLRQKSWHPHPSLT